MHFLDNFGHSILKTMNIDVVAHQAFAIGSYPDSYTVVCVGRCNNVCIIENVRFGLFREKLGVLGFRKKQLVLLWIGLISSY